MLDGQYTKRNCRAECSATIRGASYRGGRYQRIELAELRAAVWRGVYLPVMILDRGRHMRCWGRFTIIVLVMLRDMPLVVEEL